MDVNIKVAVRCRPMSSKERDMGCQCVVQISDKTVKLINSEKTEDSREFTFDHSYFTDTTQEQVYTDLGKKVVTQALDGYNGTIFAYGQTGSGKTHTMMGSPDNPGIIPTLNSDLFAMMTEKMEALAGQDKSTTKMLLTVSYLEIYNETIKDLLNPSDKQLKIKESPQQGVFVKDLCELIVKDSSEVMRLIEQGNTVRRVAATNMNEMSSRSHSCFTLKIEQKTTTELEGGVSREKITKAKINLVDLAGSERASKTGASGATLKEGAKINLSLMTLGTVINALAASGPKGHINYRDSLLTRLLQESLGGNAATVMIAAISPADYNYDETLSTLKYANRAKSIENVVTRNEDVTEKMIRELKETIEKLKRELASGGGRGDPEIEGKLIALQNEQRNAWEERERLQQQLMEERNANMNNVIATMMKDIKDQKLQHMKNVKKLTLQKNEIQSKQKDVKEKCDALKTKLEGNMGKYQKMQKLYETLDGSKPEHAQQKEELSSHMAQLLTTIENDRAIWTEKKDALKSMKKTLAGIEESIATEKAELVATHGLLDQNDKLREKIQEEEREKARERIAIEIEEAKQQLAREKDTVRSTIEAEMAEKVSQLNAELMECKTKLSNAVKAKEQESRKVAEIDEYCDKLEKRLADSEALYEQAQGEIESLQRQIEEMTSAEVQAAKDREMQAVAEQERAKALSDAAAAETSRIAELKRQHEEEKYAMFKSLMDAFAAEREQLEGRNTELQQLLSQATKDIMYLSQKNAELSATVSELTHWEPPIVPSQGPRKCNFTNGHA